MSPFGANRFARTQSDNPILAALQKCREAFVSLALFSCLINILMLTGSFYMLQVYDRVLLSNSVPTLVALSVMALVAYSFQGFLEVVRTRVFGRIAERIELATGPSLYNLLVRLQARQYRVPGEPMQPFRDLDAIRSFMSGTGPVALFDLPWLPIYLILCFFLHPLIGVFALCSSVVLIAVAIISEKKSHRPTRSAHDASAQRQIMAMASLTGAEVILAMGMLTSMRTRWAKLNDKYSTLSLRANDVMSGMAASSRTLRMVIQSATLGLGAYLVIKGEMTGGTIIAASIISSRALAPVDMAVGAYKGFQQAMHGYGRLSDVFRNAPAEPEIFPLPAPTRLLTVEHLVVVSPKDARPIIKGVSLHVTAGQGVGIIGPSASGKSTLGRALVGLWQPARGSVALDGASLSHWDPESLGRHVGYLPHDVQLFDGTIAENISRFDPAATPETVYKAAQLAGCYNLILALPDGFNTRVGGGGTFLSAGQRQRIGLARALFGDPFLVVLDEPNANLDADGEAALTSAIKSVRARNGIAIVIAHRPSAIAAVDHVLVMHDGFAASYGLKDEVLKELSKSAAARPPEAIPGTRAPGQPPAQGRPESRPPSLPPRQGAADGSPPAAGSPGGKLAGDAA